MCVFDSSKNNIPSPRNNTGEEYFSKHALTTKKEAYHGRLTIGGIRPSHVIVSPPTVIGAVHPQPWPFGTQISF